MFVFSIFSDTIAAAAPFTHTYINASRRATLTLTQAQFFTGAKKGGQVTQNSKRM